MHGRCAMRLKTRVPAVTASSSPIFSSPPVSTAMASHATSPEQPITLATLAAEPSPGLGLSGNDKDDPKKKGGSKTDPRLGAPEWEVVLETLKRSDMNEVSSLTNEVNNLLIFTGLFSAVVTAFTIWSVTFLQQDPASTSQQVLGQVSNQLRSLTVTSRFINSTAPAASDPTSQFTPLSVFITVNKLWYSSLTLSLSVAFFSLTVQQWFRQYPVPEHLPVRDAVRLRQYRFAGWTRWRVQAIVSALSLALQIAVVLFVIGLVDALRHLNNDVALPVMVIAYLWVALFSITSVLPLVDPSCPYKSGLNSIRIIHGVIRTPVIALYDIITLGILIPLDAILQCIATPHHTRLSVFADTINHYTTRLYLSLGDSRGINTDRWAKQELSRSQRKSERMDMDSLVLFSTSGTPIKRILPCVLDLPPPLRTRCVLQWISMKTGGSVYLDVLLSKGVISSHTLERVDPPFANEFGPLLMQVLSEGWDDPKEYEHDEQKDLDPWFRHFDIDMPHILMLLWQVAKVNGELKYGQDPDTQEDIRSILIKQLVNIYREQRTDLNDKSLLRWNPVVRVPSVLLCDLLVDKNSDKNLFTSEDPLSFVLWTNQQVVAIVFSGDQSATDATMFWYAPAEHIFTSTAVTLAILVRSTTYIHGESRHLDAVRELFAQLNNFIVAGKDRILEIIDDQRLASDSDLPFMTPRAIGSIADSLKQLGEVKILPMDNTCPSRAFAENLLDICGGEGRGSLVDAREHIQGFLELREKSSHTRREFDVQEVTVPELLMSDIGSVSGEEEDDDSK